MLYLNYFLFYFILHSKISIGTNCFFTKIKHISEFTVTWPPCFICNSTRWRTSAGRSVSRHEKCVCVCVFFLFPKAFYSRSFKIVSSVSPAQSQYDPWTLLRSKHKGSNFVLVFSYFTFFLHVSVLSLSKGYVCVACFLNDLSLYELDWATSACVNYSWRKFLFQKQLLCYCMSHTQ